MRYGELGMDQMIRPVVGGFVANSPAEAAGLKVGDMLIDIDGKPVDHFTHIPELIGDRAGQPVAIQYERDGQRYKTTVVPEADKVTDCTGKDQDDRPAAHPSGRRDRVPPARHSRRDGRRHASRLEHDPDVLHVDGADRDGGPAGR